MADIKCFVCGDKLTGPCLYCDGCSGYTHMPCAVAAGENVWDCPNCAIQMQQTNI
jgi:hypothetical protein